MMLKFFSWGIKGLDPKQKSWKVNVLRNQSEDKSKVLKCQTIFKTLNKTCYRIRLLDTTVFFTTTSIASVRPSVEPELETLTTVVPRVPPLRTTPSTSGVSNFQLLLGNLSMLPSGQPPLICTGMPLRKPWGQPLATCLNSKQPPPPQYELGCPWESLGVNLSPHA